MPGGRCSSGQSRSGPRSVARCQGGVQAAKRACLVPRLQEKHCPPETDHLVAFKRTAEIVRDYVKKGTKLYIEGKLSTRSWDDKESGQKRYKTEIVVFDLSLLSGREEGAGSSAGGGYNRAASSSSSTTASFDQRPQASSSGPDEYAQQAEISDDDIPF